MTTTRPPDLFVAWPPHGTDEQQRRAEPAAARRRTGRCEPGRTHPLIAAVPTGANAPPLDAAAGGAQVHRHFVWSASSAASSRTGVLRVRLGARGVRGARMLPAVIESTRPRLLR